MSARDGCGCGCLQSAEARAMAEQIAAERRADFERLKPAPIRVLPPREFLPLAPDEETRALRASRLPTPVVRPVIG